MSKTESFKTKSMCMKSIRKKVSKKEMKLIQTNIEREKQTELKSKKRTKKMKERRQRKKRNKRESV